ncbi:DNA internalization-related competence protein ComEC/Rec2 [Rhodoferax sp. UBA5149]|uniref:DNA internalization-related competence protein ComEC/Rec2 n=1 Tax=Rhodoferax sp. UBA5149 TaxID=1947379 RepID=UPI0025E81BDF|nr:DNA internalization-related competence protein ComEC/Rec2 [Rhodoferax sp. UBA5149]
MAGRPAIARLLFPALLGLVLGTAVQLQQAALHAWPVYVCFMLLAPVLWALAATKFIAKYLAIGWRMVLAALACGVLAFGLTGLRASVFLNDALDAGLEGRDVAVTGVIAAMPQHNEAGVRFRLEVESAQLMDKPVRLPPSIYLGWYSGVFGGSGAGGVGELQRQPAAIEAGERWQMTLRLKAPHGGSNPHGFDYELWLWEQGLQATGYVRAGPKDPPPQRLAQTGMHPVERARQQVRDRIFERVAERKYAGLIAALVVGDQNAIDRADWDIFRATGVAHLMSISGLHVTMFAWLAALAVGWLWRRSEYLCLRLPAPSAALAGGVLLATAYAFFSGWGVPSQRTVLMLATVGLLRLSGKQWPWPHVWLLACAVVVAMDPWALLQAGFWLSFVAVGVLFATDSGADSVDRTGARGHFYSMFREQWVITLALTPLTLLLFGQVSVVGLVANALAIPWVTLVVTPLAMLGVLAAPLWDLAALAIAAMAWYLQLLAALPFATVSVAQAPLWAGAAGVVGGLLLAMQLPWSLRLMGLPLMLPVLLWQAPRPLQGQFELLAADIGQGNAVLVRTARHVLMYDAGPRFSRESDAGHRVLVPLLRALDAPVDMLMLSHRDSDHVGGALAVLAMQPQAVLLSSIEDDHELQAVRRATRCVAGQRWRWDGVDFEVLHPRAGDYDAANKSNAMSCTLRISNGVQSALLAGDIEQAQEARLVAEGASLKVDVLLVPHHGSKTSSSAAFLDAVQPRIALVQAGYRNRFGHPAEPVLARYAERHIRVVDSPHCGAATWQSAHPLDVKCQRTEGLRYWHHRVPS